MREKYLAYLSGFLNKLKTDRIICELNSKSKRQSAFSKIADFKNTFDKSCVFTELSHLEYDKAIKLIEKCAGKIECYDLAYDEIVPIETAYQRAVDSYMPNVLIVSENTIIYIGECEFGASEKYILKK